MCLKVVVDVKNKALIFDVSGEQWCPAKKQIKMESKVKFDLNGRAEAVISARIVYTDDVRDKVACIFKEKFSYESCIASVFFKGQGKTGDTVHIGSGESIIPGSGFQYYDLEITPLDANKDTQKVVRSMSYMQMQSLMSACINELLYRKSGGNIASEDELRPHIKLTKDIVEEFKKELCNMVIKETQVKG